MKINVLYSLVKHPQGNVSHKIEAYGDDPTIPKLTIEDLDYDATILTYKQAISVILLLKGIHLKSEEVELNIIKASPSKKA
jgi:hypothetical protein